MNEMYPPGSQPPDPWAPDPWAPCWACQVLAGEPRTVPLTAVCAAHAGIADPLPARQCGCPHTHGDLAGEMPC
jgi:hypothetical protein